MSFPRRFHGHRCAHDSLAITTSACDNSAVWNMTRIGNAVWTALQGFLGCRHFSQTNQLLVKSGQPPIDWQIDEV